VEWDGVLLSGRVQRTFTIRDKRAGVQVEESSLELQDFEGPIPRGYGGGTVDWDEGFWELGGCG
jgi:bifunctional non-homologous end joining protein LigD